VLQVLNRRDGKPFDSDDCYLLEAVAGLVAVAVDNAAQHEALVKAERLATVGQTVAGLAHCIKNVLNGLKAGSHILQAALSKVEAGDDVDKGWGMVARNLDFLSNIVMDMLTYAKPRKPVRQPCLVSEVCQDVVDLLAQKAANNGVALTTQLDDHLDEALLDEMAIRRCLLNLADNAIDACATGEGSVVLSTGRSGAGDGVWIRIHDNGCGLDPALRDKIFEPLFSTKGSKGTGLGLAVTKKIVEEHGGTLTVASEPGRGTEFLMELPVGSTCFAGVPPVIPS
jgi:signal transduction histidine kinase